MCPDYNNEDYINNLVDKYKEMGEEKDRIELISCFDPYFKKYAGLLCTRGPVDLNNKDTIKFLRLFMSLEDRLNDESIYQAAKKVVSYLRRIFKDCTTEDIYNDMICYFLEQLERYKSMIAKNTKEKKRISFTHFIQVNLRYRLQKNASIRGKDALHRMYNVEYDDELYRVERKDNRFNWNEIDLRWVHGMTTGDVFRELDESERYLIFLKYEENINKPLSDYDVARITGVDRMYIRRKMLKIKEKLKQLSDVA